MKFQDINEALRALWHVASTLEDTYIENGGEVTEETEALEEEKEALRALLNSEGVDSLGRYLKAKEDAKVAAKAEVARAQARVKAIERGIDHAKGLVGMILRETEQQEVKGIYYGFKQATSTTTSVDKARLAELYTDRVNSALSDVLPPYVGVTLTASVKMVPSGTELPDIFVRNSEDTVRFSKPRNAKEA